MRLTIKNFFLAFHAFLSECEKSYDVETLG